MMNKQTSSHHPPSSFGFQRFSTHPFLLDLLSNVFFPAVPMACEGLEELRLVLHGAMAGPTPCRRHHVDDKAVSWSRCSDGKKNGPSPWPKTMPEIGSHMVV